MPTAPTSTASDRVKAVRALHGRPGRRRAGAFLVEGPQAVQAALTSGRARVREVIVDDGPTAARFADAGRAAGVRVTRTTAEVVAAMAETEHPQGVLAVCDLLPIPDLAAAMRGLGPVVVLDAVADPGNVGTVIRSAAAVGAAAVVLTPGCVDVHNGKVVRATAGALFDLPVVAGIDVDQALTAARAAGRRVVVTAGEATDDLFSAAAAGRVDARTCWIIGSEAHGVGPSARAGADTAIRIPMAEGPQSLNAAVAAAVVLYVTAYAVQAASGSDGRLAP